MTGVTKMKKIWISVTVLLELASLPKSAVFAETDDVVVQTYRDIQWLDSCISFSDETQESKVSFDSLNVYVVPKLNILKVFKDQ